MFDFAFSELALIGVVALIVIGPKRLPIVARMAGKIFGQVNRYVAQVKREVEKEIQAAEVAELKKEFLKNTKDLGDSIKSEISEVENKIQAEMNSQKEQLKYLNDEIKPENDLFANHNQNDRQDSTDSMDKSKVDKNPQS